MRYRWWIPAGLLTTALVVAACGSQSPAPKSPAASATGSASPGVTASLRSEKTSQGTLLANSKGYTLYWFSKDSATSSACTGKCAVKWPPVLGTPKAAAGTTLAGKLGTITRAGGARQATYNGHPLYTFVGDTAPGQDHGNLLNVFGGVWYSITVSGAASGTPAPSPSSSGGGGYGGGY